jgi:hypothetical protein
MNRGQSPFQKGPTLIGGMVVFYAVLLISFLLSGTDARAVPAKTLTISQNDCRDFTADLSIATPQYLSLNGGRAHCRLTLFVSATISKNIFEQLLGASRFEMQDFVYKDRIVGGLDATTWMIIWGSHNLSIGHGYPDETCLNVGAIRVGSQEETYRYFCTVAGHGHYDAVNPRILTLSSKSEYIGGVKCTIFSVSGLIEGVLCKFVYIDFTGRDLVGFEIEEDHSVVEHSNFAIIVLRDGLIGKLPRRPAIYGGNNEIRFARDTESRSKRICLTDEDINKKRKDKKAIPILITTESATFFEHGKDLYKRENNCWVPVQDF